MLSPRDKKHLLNLTWHQTTREVFCLKPWNPSCLSEGSEPLIRRKPCDSTLSWFLRSACLTNLNVSFVINCTSDFFIQTFDLFPFLGEAVEAVSCSYDAPRAELRVHRCVSGSSGEIGSPRGSVTATVMVFLFLSDEPAGIISGMTCEQVKCSRNGFGQV